MEHIDLTLNENKSFNDINEIVNLNVDLEREEKLLPVNTLQGKIDAYEQYLKEKDACSKYRLEFSIRPYCTNVLFNRITEAVYKEGTQYAQLFLDERNANISSLKLGYAEHKKVSIPVNSPITRDTGYSSDLFNNTKHLDYNCGIDIFNNHLLRRKEFVCINDIADNSSDDTKRYLNTLFDYLRDQWGWRTYGYAYQTKTEEQKGLHT